MVNDGQVRFEEIVTHEDRVAAAALYADIWGLPVSESPVPADLMVSITHAGGCVLGAWSPSGELVGSTVGFTGGPGSDSLFSYIAGVAASAAGQGLGRQLKLAQRAWALERGVTSMVWTYDPLIRRNAHFNLDRLGGQVVDFRTDYYPPMHDAVNRGDLTDRFVVRWDLSAEPGGRDVPANAAPANAVAPPVALADGPDGPRHIPLRDVPLSDMTNAAGSPPAVVLAAIPADIEGLRRADPALGMRWRLAARAAFTELFAAGLRPVGVNDTGHYVFTPRGSSPQIDTQTEPQEDPS
ncbi:MAG: hypothetical protein KBB39_13210 [Phycicoccus sp.]|nr:hypothetical protein [Phycicoccus sp.]